MIGKDMRAPLRLGVVPGIASLYDRLWPEMRQMVREAVRKTCAAIEDRTNLAATLKEPVNSAENFLRAARDLEKEGADLLLIVLPPYCPSGVFWPAAAEIRVPVVVWPHQTILRLDPERYGREEIWLNHGVHAAQDVCNVFRRNGVPFGVFHGHVDQEETLPEIAEWTQAGAAARAMREANPVQIGGHFEEMLDLQIGDAPFLRELGATCEEVSFDRLLEEMKAVDDRAAKERCEFYREVFSVGDDVSESLLEKTARGDLAVRSILEKSGSTAVGLNFLTLCNDERIADALHVAASLLMREGFGYGGEGDWITALLVRGLQRAAGAASFSEMFSVGYEDNRLVLKHWGEGNPVMARETPKLAASELNDRIKAEFAIVDFEFAPGEATLVNLNETPEGRGQLIATTGEITEDHLPKAAGPRAVFRPDAEDVRDLLTAYARTGGSHHLALLAGKRKSLIAKIAQLLNWEFVSL